MQQPVLGQYAPQNGQPIQYVVQAPHPGMAITQPPQYVTQSGQPIQFVVQSPPQAQYQYPMMLAPANPPQPPVDTNYSVSVHRSNNMAQAPSGHWKDALCDWGSNLFPSCFFVCSTPWGIGAAWLVSQSE